MYHLSEEKRFEAQILSKLGYSTKYIAESLNCTKKTARLWAQRTVGQIQNRRGQGRKRKYNKKKIKQIKATLKKTNSIRDIGHYKGSRFISSCYFKIFRW